MDIEFRQGIMRVYSSGEEARSTLGAERPQSQKTDYVYPQFLSGPILASEN